MISTMFFFYVYLFPLMALTFCRLPLIFPFSNVIDAFNGLSMIGHLKLAHLDLQSLNSFVFRGLRHVQVTIP